MISDDNAKSGVFFIQSNFIQDIFQSDPHNEKYLCFETAACDIIKSRHMSNRYDSNFCNTFRNLLVQKS